MKPLAPRVSAFDGAPAGAIPVAVHQDNLIAPRARGLQRACVERPAEFGADQRKYVSPDLANILHAHDCLGPADQLTA